HTDAIGAVAFFKDGRRVVTASSDRTLQIWDLDSEKRAILIAGPGHIVNSVAVSPDDRRIASGREDDNTIIIWDVKSKHIVFDPVVKHTGKVWSVCFSPDGRRLASGSWDETIITWD
ncbi:WD40 repeat-like protein, partial [Suillus weaverae]